MPGPFPGMDPYIEAQANWQDFHNTLIIELRNSLGSRLPDDYFARSDERIEVVDIEGTTDAAYLPDVLVVRDDLGRPKKRGDVEDTAVTKVGPVSVVVLDHALEEVRHTWLEIRRLPDLEPVTVIEVLSPVNKGGAGRLEYLSKRHDLYARKINLVEIDLLLGGNRLPSRPRLGGGHYFAIVARGPNLPNADAYGWTVRDRLPDIPIPLRAPDRDVMVPLQELVDRVYDLGRYGKTLRYDRPLPEGGPLQPEDRAWCERPSS